MSQCYLVALLTKQIPLPTKNSLKQIKNVSCQTGKEYVLKMGILLIYLDSDVGTR
jgi:hypothetical protein